MQVRCDERNSIGGQHEANCQSPGRSGARKQNRRRARQRGAEIVEVSLIAIPLFGLIFLCLDLAMALCVRSAFQHAVREGVRYAITGANDTGPCHDDSIKAVVKSHALGFLNSTTGTNAIHVHFINPVDGSVSDNSYGSIVGVTIEGYQWTPWAPYMRSGAALSMWARAYDMMEPLPGQLPCITTSE